MLKMTHGILVLISVTPVVKAVQLEVHHSYFF